MRGDCDPEPEANIQASDAVCLTGRAWDVDAGNGIDVAPLPLIGERGRVATPGARIRRELLANSRGAGNRRPRRVRQRCGVRLHHVGRIRAGLGRAVGVACRDADAERMTNVDGVQSEGLPVSR